MIDALIVRLLLWRPTQEIILAWRFWTALRAGDHADWRDRIAWASSVMMARALKAKGHTFPMQVELTERNLAPVRPAAAPNFSAFCPDPAILAHLTGPHGRPTP